MKELFIKILRFLMFVLVVALGCIGYNIYEDTLAAVCCSLIGAIHPSPLGTICRRFVYWTL
jgi:hypothetical protein